MAWREWPLVAFTLLAQFAAGFHLFAALPAVLAGGTGDAARAARLHALGIAAAAAFAAAVLSFFHLARPWNAPRAISNLGSSWLSREILLELLFLGLLGAAFLLTAAGRDGGAAVRVCAAAAGAAGIGLVAAMSGIYMVPGVPAWNTAATPATFAASAATLGGLGAIALATATGVRLPFAAVGIAVAVALGATLAFALLLTPGIGALGVRPAPGLRPVPAIPGAWFAARIVLLVLAAACVEPLWRGTRGAASLRGDAPSPAFALAAFILATASETIARFAFYGWGKK